MGFQSGAALTYGSLYMQSFLGNPFYTNHSAIKAGNSLVNGFTLFLSHRRPRFPRQVKDPPFHPLPASTSTRRARQEGMSPSSPSTTKKLPLQRRTTKMILWSTKTTPMEPSLTLTKKP